ncbi:MAG: hypothetical protein QOG11_1178 [Solirubrobacteraceae bacterium]|nr:hypothetical protein [Solirubrobacteraceae bacterium]
MAQASARTHSAFSPPSAPSAPVLRSVPPLDRQRTGGGLDLAALADMMTASGSSAAKHARRALAPVIAHDALVLLTPDWAGAPVQIAAAPRVRDRLAATEWSPMVRMADKAEDGTAVRITLHHTLDGLSTAGWTATSGTCTVWLMIGARGGLQLEPAQERAAAQVAMLAAARARRIDDDPPPGSLAFSRAMSLERERVRAQLSSQHEATLSGLLHTLRRANGGGSRTAPPEVTRAIDLASHALLDLETRTERHESFGRVALSKAFADAEGEARRVVQAVPMRVFADLDAEDGAYVPQAIAQAARFLSGAVALNATRHGGADKLRLLWRLTPERLTITVADNGVGPDPGEQIAKLADVQRRLIGLDGAIELDSNAHWGTTVTCRLPLHDIAASPETPASLLLEQLRDREREVLELMMSGLRNRDIADRLFITVRTVKYHVSNILQRLDVASRTEAIALAHSAGISARPSDR